jgi:hypothetical protein
MTRHRTFHPDRDAHPYTGPHTPYDIIKEGAIAFLVVSVLTLLLAISFGSPDEKFVTLKAWSTAAPLDFAQTALSELNGTSAVATYGAPYNTSSTGQTIGPLQLQKWGGVRVPVNTAQDFILRPLAAFPSQPGLTADLATWRAATTSQRRSWESAYATGLSTMTFSEGHVQNYVQGSGPVTRFIDDITSMARTGALDQALVTQNGFYTTDYTKPLLFLADGTWFDSLAGQQNLHGDQWGMMNETGSYPGQAWLWLYTFWYQINPFASSDNADAWVWGLMVVLTAILALVPFIPGLRTIPRKVKLYRVIWREHYEK